MSSTVFRTHSIDKKNVDAAVDFGPRCDRRIAEPSSRTVAREKGDRAPVVYPRRLARRGGKLQRPTVEPRNPSRRFDERRRRL